MTKVLIIDDEKAILESLSSVLKDEGFEVSTAKDGREGLDVFERERPRVVLLDVWMPEMDGLEVLKRIREKDPEAVVVVISGHGTISTAVEAVKMGAIDFLEKPLSIDKVLEVVNRGLKGQEYGRETTEALQTGIAADIGGRRQKTIGKSMVVYGLGLHSGVKTGMILLPMPAGTGIVFEHVPDGERIPAFIDCVFSSGHASSLKGKNCTIKTVEHLLATLHLYGITNLLVKVSEEVPIFDGSAREICEKLDEAGIAEQQQRIEPLIVDRKVAVPNLQQGKSLSIEPADQLEIHYTLEYPRPIGRQEFLFKGGKDEFIREIAPSRTFGYIKDFEKLAKLGLGSGSRVDNVILMNDEDVINTKLRYDDEFVRHKVLDVMGDLYLLGRPVIGKVIAERTGHMENIALDKELKRLFL